MNQTFMGPINDGQFAERIINISYYKPTKSVSDESTNSDYVKVLSPDVCPSCETRFLAEEREWCHHCEDQYNQQILIEESERKKNKLIFIILVSFFAILAISFLLIKLSPEPLSRYAVHAFFGTFILYFLCLRLGLFR